VERQEQIVLQPMFAMLMTLFLARKEPPYASNNLTKAFGAVEVVESYMYLGCLIHCSGSSEPEIKRRANIVCEAMFCVDQNIWQSSIMLETKLHLYNTCILPIFLYGAETWSVTDLIKDDRCIG